MANTNLEYTTIIGEPKILDEILAMFSDWEGSSIKFTRNMKKESIILQGFKSERKKDNELFLSFTIRGGSCSSLWEKLTGQYPVIIRTTYLSFCGMEDIWDLTFKNGELVQQLCIKNPSILDNPDDYVCYSTFTGQKFEIISTPAKNKIADISQTLEVKA